MPRSLPRPFFRIAILLIALAPLTLAAQPATAPAQSTAPEPELPADALGRTTPRGTVMGFLAAARKGDNELASHYLATKSGGEEAETLAHQLFVVLDARLPARLTQVSAETEGSGANPLAPEQERVGSIDGPSGRFDVVVERVKRPKAAAVWLFSAETLEAIPIVFDDIEQARRGRWLPRFMTERRVAGVRLYEWVAVIIGLPLFYAFTVLLNRALTPLVAFVGRRFFARVDVPVRSALPAPARLLLVSVACRWLLATLPLSLLVRQYLSNGAAIAAIIALAWLVIVINAEFERSFTRRVSASNRSAALSLLRVGRRIFDIVIVLVAMLALLRHFGVDPTPLLAGLGVGGIAVALAAQKTLENVIAGASLIFDQAVRVGDFLKVGTIEGTVDHIGLRSTRIRTLDRSIVSVPNSQIANMSLETLSERDKYWFHPVVGLRYETTTDQMRLVLDGVRQMLERHGAVDGASVRVRFLRLGAFSLDVEVFAYVFARDWAHFLEIQEGLLLRITEIVSASGTEIAFPSQTMYVNAVNAQGPIPNAQFPKPN